MGHEVFRDCLRLKVASLPSTLSVVGVRIFENTPQLSTVRLLSLDATTRICQKCPNFYTLNLDLRSRRREGHTLEITEEDDLRQYRLRGTPDSQESHLYFSWPIH
eukprot:m.7407 g.7407  ORF g.7407 m.7407 type:complete len:105 (+) comp3959_c0_seq1:978-1292(+)